MRNNCLSTAAIAVAVSLLLMHLSSSRAADETPSTGAVSVRQSDKVSEKVSWDVLAPQNGEPFDDPLSKLTTGQCVRLAHVLRVRRLITSDRLEPDGPDAIETAQLAAELEQQGVDIEWLVAQRRHIQRARNERLEGVSKSVAKSLKSRLVVLDGYATPVRTESGEVFEFLLTPTVAMCRHANAPSPLHVVHVTSERGILQSPAGFPVRVSGQLMAESQTTPIISASGIQPFVSAYKLTASAIEFPETIPETDQPD